MTTIKQGPLPLLLLSAIDHPSDQVRSRIWKLVKTWITQLEPTIDYKTVEKLIENVSGTSLEPFTVTGDNKKLAAFLVCAAFSKKINKSRFRIVSEQTVGNLGGAVFTKNGSYFYSESFILGTNKLNKSNICFFSPSTKPLLSKWNNPAAKLLVSDKEAIIEINDVLKEIGFKEKENSKFLNDLRHNSVIGKDKKTLLSLGMDISLENRKIKISSKSPESLIRFSSYLVTNDKIFLKTKMIESAKFDIVINLEVNDKKNLKCYFLAKDSFAYEWMNVNSFASPNIEPRLIEEISHWAFPHSEWEEKQK